MEYSKPFKPLWIAALVLLSSVQVWASDIDADEAMNIATHFIKSPHSGGSKAPANLSLRLVHTERSASRAGSAAYYVFNADNDQAFVIVAGDDRAEQILAYGDHAFDMNHIPCNVQAWLKEYKTQIEWLASHVADDTAGVAPPRLRAPARVGSIEPMVTSRWSQDEPYYNLCPEYNGEYCATDCIATAMAQVMYYWKYPEELPPLPGYETSYLLLGLPELPGVRLDWDNMIDSYDNGYTDSQAEAVATLMRYCGQGAFMEYTPEASGASEMEQLAAMVTFGYNPDAECLYRDNINNDDRWNSMLLEDLVAGRPILYCGTSWDGGHAFILDGYEDGLYHVNWGWGGYYDGYYALDALGKGDWAFNFYHSILYHMYPDEAGSTTPRYDFEQAGVYYKCDGDAVQVTYRDTRMNSYSGEVVIPESVTWEGKTYPVTTIARGAFMNSMNLTSVTVPASVKSIGEGAFMNCRGLSAVRIYGTGLTIEDAAFYECWNLKRLYVDDVASWCSVSLASYYANPLFFGASLYDRNGNMQQDIVIPGSVKEVKSYAFSWCPGLRSVTIEEGITSIGECAFYYCDDLTSITLPGSLRYTGEFAFAYNSGLKSVVMPEGITSISEAAFYYCVALDHVDIPNSVTDIGYAAFAYCNGLSSVKLGSGLVRLSDYVFYDCEALTSITIPDNVTSIGNALFADATGLEQVTLSNNLSEIPEATFYNCVALRDVNMPQGLTAIGEGAFYSAKALTSITIPKGVSSIGELAFKQCTKLERVDITDLKGWCNITFGDQSANPLNVANHLYINGEELGDLIIPDGVTAINTDAFYRCYSITSLTIGPDVESIGENAFLGCKNMVSVETGDGVRRIGEKAFSNCNSLADFTFGSRVDSVGMQAFASCSNLVNITSRAITPPSMKGTATFTDKTYNRATVHVPAQSVEEYKQSLVWKRFAHIEGYNLAAVLADVNADGEVTIADVNAILRFIIDESKSMNCDVNGDGEVNIADVNTVINIITQGF